MLRCTQASYLSTSKTKNSKQGVPKEWHALFTIFNDYSEWLK